MILERLKQYIDSQGISTAAFERSVGMGNASFYKMLKSGGAIGTDKLERIVSVYPDISPEWLLTGRGAMLAAEHSEGSANIAMDNRVAITGEGNSVESLSERFIGLLEKKDEQINEMLRQMGEKDQYTGRLIALLERSLIRREVQL